MMTLFFTVKVFTTHFHFMARLSTNSNVCKRQWEDKGPIHGGEKAETPWKHSHTLIAYLWLSPTVQDHTHSTNSLLARPCTNRLIIVPQAAIHIEGWCFESAENIQKIHWWICMLFHKKLSSNDSKTVKKAVSGALGVEWASSKGTRPSTYYVNEMRFHWKSLGIFWTVVIIIHADKMRCMRDCVKFIWIKGILFLWHAF